jgi:hypothetical protein
MPTYSDSEMRAIMGRALQIDSGRSERFTPEQLRSIAAELGISTQALEVAMYEADSGARGLNVHAPAPAPRRWAGLAIAAGVLAIAALWFGAMRMAVRPSESRVVRASEAAPARAISVTKKTTVEAVPTPTPATDQPTPVAKATKKRQ